VRDIDDKFDLFGGYLALGFLSSSAGLYL